MIHTSLLCFVLLKYEHIYCKSGCKLCNYKQDVWEINQQQHFINIYFVYMGDMSLFQLPE